MNRIKGENLVRKRADIVGRWGEEKAKLYLMEQGYQILCQNYWTKHGEIDIIAQHGNTIIFVEVKTRRSLAYGSGIEAITRKKLQRIRKAATHYLTSSATFYNDIRLDMIDIFISKEGTRSTYRVKHIQHIDS